MLNGLVLVLKVVLGILLLTIIVCHSWLVKLQRTVTGSEALRKVRIREKRVQRLRNLFAGLAIALVLYLLFFQY